MTYTEEMTTSEILLRLASMRNELLQAVNDIEKISKNICYKAEQTENSSEKPSNCEYAKNPSGDVWECGCFLDTYCEHQIYDRNPDGTINIVECGYEPKDEPTCSKMEQVDKDINVRSKDEPQTATLYDQIVEDIEIRVKCANAKKIEDEPQTCDTCKYGEDKHRYAHICNECGVGINNYEPKDEPKTQMKTQNSNLTFEKTDEPQTQLTARCLNCNNAKACKEKHWESCLYEPKDEKTCETCRHWKYIAHEWQCEACKCQGYEPKDEPQTEPLPKAINGVKIADAVAWADKWLEDNPVSEMWDMIRTLRDATEWQDEPQTDCAWK